jgi:hypothetical protein
MLKIRNIFINSRFPQLILLNNKFGNEKMITDLIKRKVKADSLENSQIDIDL